MPRPNSWRNDNGSFVSIISIWNDTCTHINFHTSNTENTNQKFNFDILEGAETNGTLVNVAIVSYCPGTVILDDRYWFWSSCFNNEYEKNNLFCYNYFQLDSYFLYNAQDRAINKLHIYIQRYCIGQMDNH